MTFFGKVLKIAGKIGKWTSWGLNFVPYLSQAMAIVELLSSAKGEAKRKQAIELLKMLVSASEELSGKDLLNDAEVIKAAESAIDSIVALQNIVAKKEG